LIVESVDRAQQGLRAVRELTQAERLRVDADAERLLVFRRRLRRHTLAVLDHVEVWSARREGQPADLDVGEVEDCLERQRDLFLDVLPHPVAALHALACNEIARLRVELHDRQDVARRATFSIEP
jgi:hypothetical protein